MNALSLRRGFIGFGNISLRMLSRKRKVARGAIDATGELASLNKGGRTIVTEDDISEVMEAARTTLAKQQQDTVTIVGSDELRSLDSKHQYLMILDQFRLHGKCKESWIRIYLKQLVKEGTSHDVDVDTSQVIQDIEHLLLTYQRAGQFTDSQQLSAMFSSLITLSVECKQNYALHVLTNYKRYRIFPTKKQYQKLIRYYTGDFAALDILWNTYAYKRSDALEYPMHMVHWWIRAYDGICSVEDADPTLLFAVCKQYIARGVFDKIASAILLKVLIGQDTQNTLTEANGSQQMMNVLQEYISSTEAISQYGAVTQLMANKQ